MSRSIAGADAGVQPRSAEHGFTPSRRSAEHGFTPLKRSAEHGFTPVRRSAEHGFTLVEVMVSLLIFGMLAAAGVALLSFGIRAQGATAVRLDEIGAMGRLGAALSADLAQAMPRATRDDRGTPLPAFIGDGTRMQLVRGGWTNLDNDPRADQQKVAWVFDRGTLSRVAWPMLDGAEPLEPAPMLTGLRSASFRYRINGAWSDRWDGAAGVPLPQAVELTVVGRDGAASRQLFLAGTGYQGPPDA